MPLKAERFTSNPIIHSGLSPRLGDNINGPSVIRVPEWVNNPLGAYYLYFAHHMGRFIRLAYADRLEGPWTVHEPGVLDVEESLFVMEDLTEVPEVPGGAWAARTGNQFLYAHIASPDVHVDNEARIIRMYYHGLLASGDQQTRLATSRDGLAFEPLPALLGPPYFRVFPHGDWIYAISWAGVLQRTNRWDGPFESGPELFTGPPLNNQDTTIRHAGLLCRDDRLDLFYSRIGDEPECILHTIIDLSDDWSNWQIHPPRIVLKPEISWEGADLPLTLSRVGAADGRERALRDPFIIVDENKIYLFYSGAGENAIGVALLTGL